MFIYYYVKMENKNLSIYLLYFHTYSQQILTHANSMF